MSAYASQAVSIAHCTDSEDLPGDIPGHGPFVYHTVNTNLHINDDLINIRHHMLASKACTGRPKRWQRRVNYSVPLTGSETITITRLKRRVDYF